jgi:hypothetical protein
MLFNIFLHSRRSFSSSSSSSGVHDGRCDDGEFTPDSADVAEEAAVEPRRTDRPTDSLQTPRTGYQQMCPLQIPGD